MQQSSRSTLSGMLFASGVFHATLLTALFVAPCSWHLSYGQEGFSLEVSSPAVGTAPVPPQAHAPVPPQAPAPSDQPAIPDTPSESPIVQSEIANDDFEESAEQDSDPADLETAIAQMREKEAAKEKSPAAQKPTQEVARLSVPPTEPYYPANLPKWINSEPNYSGKVHRIAVGSGPVMLEEETDAALSAPMMAAFGDYLDNEVFEQVGVSDTLDISEAYVRRNLIAQSGGALVPVTIGSERRFEKWVMLEVTPEQRSHFVKLRKESVQRSRLPFLGVGFLVLLGVLGSAHMFLRRGGASATAQPLQGENLVSRGLPTRKRSALATILTVVLVLGSVCFLGLILLATLFVGLRVESADYPFDDGTHQLTVQEKGVTITRHGPSGYIGPSSDNYSVSPQLNTEDSTIVIESNGQKIIERKLN